MEEIRENPCMPVADWMQNYQEKAVKQKKSFVLASKDKPEYPCCLSTKTVGTVQLSGEITI